MADRPVDKIRKTVELELETDLRLHPLRMKLGRAELLTDALLLPLNDIEKQLKRYLTGPSAAEAEQLRKSMKKYLARLNASSEIPLDFRLKVLNIFEKELALFDGEMTAAVLNAHKIGVELVQQAARADAAYYRYLVELVSHAIELAIKLLLQSLERYQAPAVIATRQFFDLARLGLHVALALDEKDNTVKQRLYKAICNHEFLRSLDFFGKTVAQQQMTWRELQNHIIERAPIFCRSGETPPKINSKALMVSNVNRPHERARVFESLTDPLTNDCIIIPLDEFLNRLHGAMQRVRNVMQSSDMQKIDLHTEEAIQTTLVGGSGIIHALQTEEREVRRPCGSETRVVLEWDAAKAFVISTITSGSENESLPSYANPWLAIDISKGGVGLERVQGKQLVNTVGSLVGLKWLGSDGMPTLGFVRWFKEPKAGEQRIGIEFLKGQFQLARCTILGGSSDLSHIRTWPLLIMPGKGSVTAIFPFPKTTKGMTFALSFNHVDRHFKVAKILHAGPNATICSIVQADSTDILKHGRPEADKELSSNP